MPEPADAAANQEPETPTGDEAPAAGIPPSLDQVHQMNLEKVEEDDAAAAEAQGDEDDADKGADGGAGGQDDGAAGAEDAADAGDGKNEPPAADGGAGDGTGEPAAPEPPKPQDKPTAPVINTDITKAGDGKVAIKDSEGKTFYFNSLDEVPDDFEPATYKDLMKGVSDLNEKKTKDAQAANEAQQQEADAEGKRRAKAMEDTWEIEASDLQSAGLIPKDTKKAEEAKSQVYDYMSAELEKGNIITSFKQGYKSMMYDREQAEKATQQKAEDAAKKKRGGVVQPGSGGGAPVAPTTRGGGKVIQAPPSGASLDQVHQHATENL